MVALTFFPVKIVAPSFAKPVYFNSRSLPVKVYCRNSESDNSRKRLPPGPAQLPLIGNLHNLAGPLPHRALRELAREHGPLMHLQLGEVSAVVVSSPNMAQEVMKKHDNNFAQRPELLAAKILTYDRTNIVFSEGEYWKQMRKICVTELLGAKRVRSFSSIRQDEVLNLVEAVQASAGMPMNLSDKIFLMVSVIVCRAAFGNKQKDQDAVLSLAKEALSLAGGFDLADLFPSYEFIHVLSGMKPKLEKIRDKLDAVLNSIVNEHKQKLMKLQNGRGGSEDDDNDDLVDVFLKLQGSTSLQCPITINNIKAVIWDMFVAGTDTSSTTIEWTMSEIMKNPRVLKKAQAEVREAFKGKKKITEADVQELKYLKLVVKETLRLHPPVPLLLPRENKERCEIDGYEISVKTKVIINAWAIGRDPHYWKDPESFIPERFNDSSIDFKGMNFEYIPFGAGKRICPGMTFGLATVELPLAHLLYHFDWELPEGITPETLDMTEAFGAAVCRKNHLYVIPTPYIPAQDESSQFMEAKQVLN